MSDNLSDGTTDKVIPEGGGDDAVSLREVVEQAYEEAGADSSSPPEKESQGRSLSTEQNAPPGAGNTDDGKDSTQPSDEKASGQEATGRAPLEAPAHWSLPDREMFAKQTPEAQHWLMSRSQAMEAAHTQRSQEIAPIRQLSEQWKPYFDQLGVPAPMAINQLLSAEYELRTASNGRKLEIMRGLVRDYGIQAPDAEGSEPQTNPELEALRFQVQQMQQGQEGYLAQQQNVRVQNAQAQLQAFSTQADDSGKLAHPYFGEVQHEMTVMAQADMQNGIQPDLQSLYDRAVWANPVTRQKVLEAQKAETQERTRKARQASGSISGAGTSSRQDQPESLRGTLESAWESLSAA